ncbi:MAG: hypothetical protein ABGY13_10065 [Verrucomicrobiia bacterium]
MEAKEIKPCAFEIGKANGGRTPLHAAINFNRTEIKDLLRKHGGKTGEELKAEGK